MTIAGFEITSVCGPGSTTIIAPDQSNFSFASELEQEATATAFFTSSNEHCPVESVSQLIGEGFELTDHGGSSFTLALDLVRSSSFGVYPFSVRATAANEIEEYIYSSFFIVTKTCDSVELPFDKERNIAVLETGQ